MQKVHDLAAYLKKIRPSNQARAPLCEMAALSLRLQVRLLKSHADFTNPENPLLLGKEDSESKSEDVLNVVDADFLKVVRKRSIRTSLTTKKG